MIRQGTDTTSFDLVYYKTEMYDWIFRSWRWVEGPTPALIKAQKFFEERIVRTSFILPNVANLL